MFKSFKRDSGFTLVELLVVIIIIAALAAIAIPVFLNQKGGAEEAATKSDITAIAKVAAERLANSDLKVATIAGGGTAFSGNGSSISPKGDFIVVPYKANGSLDINAFCVVAQSASNGKYFAYDSVKGSGVASSAAAVALSAGSLDTDGSVKTTGSTACPTLTPQS